MIRVSNFFQVDAITIRKEDLKCQEFPLSVSEESVRERNDIWMNRSPRHRFH